MSKCESCGVRWNAKPKNKTVCNECEKKLEEGECLVF